MAKIPHNRNLAENILESIQGTIQQALTEAKSEGFGDFSWDDFTPEEQEEILAEAGLRREDMDAEFFEQDMQPLESLEESAIGSAGYYQDEEGETLPVDRLSYLGIRPDAPIRPSGSHWDYVEEGEKFRRDYDFETAEELTTFVEFSSVLRNDFDAALWLELRLEMFPGAYRVEVFVSQGGSTLGEDERIFTQILDEAYEGSFDDPEPQFNLDELEREEEESDRIFGGF